MACRFEVMLSSERCRRRAAARGGARRGGRHRVAADGVPRRAAPCRDLNRRAAAEARGRRRRRCSRCWRAAPSFTRATGGAFDVTSTPLSRCWGFLQREARLPDRRRDRAGARGRRHAARALDAARAAVRFARPRRGGELRRDRQGLRARSDGARCCARAARAARCSRPGTAACCADRRQADAAGRSTCGRGSSSRRVGRAVDPRRRRRHERRRRAVRRGRTASRYGHVIDPRTGRPADGVLGASVDHRATPRPPTRCRPRSSSADRSWRARYCDAHPETLAVLVLDEPGERTRRVRPLQRRHTGDADMNLTPEQMATGRRNFLRTIAGVPAVAALGAASMVQGPGEGRAACASASSASAARAARCSAASTTATSRSRR